MGTLTVDRIMSWEPCQEWPERRVRGVVGDGKTPLEILRSADIPPEDAIWVVARPSVIGKRTCRIFACDCAQWISLHLEVKRGIAPDKRSTAAIEVSRRFARGDATASELSAARSDAYVAAYAAARAAAWAAAYAADESAAYAAWAGAYAAESAAYAAEESAEYAAPFTRLQDMLIGYLEGTCEKTTDGAGS